MREGATALPARARGGPCSGPRQGLQRSAQTPRASPPFGFPAPLAVAGILPMPYWALGAAWVALDAVTWLQGGRGISQEAHLGGALAGTAFFLAYRRGRFPTRWYW